MSQTWLTFKRLKAGVCVCACASYPCVRLIGESLLGSYLLWTRGGKNINENCDVEKLISHKKGLMLAVQLFTHLDCIGLTQARLNTNTIKTTWNLESRYHQMRQAGRLYNNYLKLIQFHIRSFLL